MLKQTVFLLSPILISLINITLIQASEFRIQALDNCRLALQDEDNQLNLYDYVNNPAYMMLDEKVNWLKFYGNGDYFNTSLQRPYDPEMAQHLRFNFEGIKILSPRQAIWGKVSYNLDRFYHVSEAIEPRPYDKDPLVLADTTSGNIYGDGPSIQLAYHFQPFRPLGLALAVNYDISTSLKKQYTRPRTIHRNFESKFAFTYQFSPLITIGGYLNATFLQDQIELDKSWDGKTIYVRRYRSESNYRSLSGDFDRYSNLDGLNWNAALQYASANSKLKNIFQFQYFTSEMRTSDQVSLNRIDDSNWYLDGWEINSRTRWNSGRLTFGIDLRYSKEEDWSEHPSLPILITECSLVETSAGVGISWQLRNLLWVAEAGFDQQDYKYDDYQSFVYRSGKLNSPYGRSGVEIRIDQIHFLQIAISQTNYSPDFISPRYLPKHVYRSFSAGLGEKRSNYEIELNFKYSTKDGTNNQGRFDGWNGGIYTKIYVQ